ncbi:hypothetical protein NG2371_03789 [Nocardia gamkensis]|nr:hypothetical protein [Nocardia gamkensis]
MTGPGEDLEPITDLRSALRRLALHETDPPGGPDRRAGRGLPVPLGRRTTAFGDTPW